MIVQLLMGDIPERSLFAQPELTGELRKYFLLARAVRLGDLESYNKTVATHSAAFARDDTVGAFLSSHVVFIYHVFLFWKSWPWWFVCATM